MSDTNLIERLNDFADVCDKTDFDEYGLLAGDAIKALTSLQKENENLKMLLNWFVVGFKIGVLKSPHNSTLQSYLESSRKALKDI